MLNIKNRNVVDVTHAHQDAQNNVLRYKKILKDFVILQLIHLYALIVKSVKKYARQ